MRCAWRAGGAGRGGRGGWRGRAMGRSRAGRRDEQERGDAGVAPRATDMTPEGHGRRACQALREPDSRPHQDLPTANHRMSPPMACETQSAPSLRTVWSGRSGTGSPTLAHAPDGAPIAVTAPEGDGVPLDELLARDLEHFEEPRRNRDAATPAPTTGPQARISTAWSHPTANARSGSPTGGTLSPTAPAARRERAGPVPARLHHAGAVRHHHACRRGELLQHAAPAGGARRPRFLTDSLPISPAHPDAWGDAGGLAFDAS